MVVGGLDFSWPCKLIKSNLKVATAQWWWVGSKQRAPRLGAKRSRSHLRKQVRIAPNIIKRPWRRWRRKKGGDGDWTSRIAVMVGALDLAKILLALFFVSVRGCSSNKKKCRTILVQRSCCFVYSLYFC